MEGVFQLTIQKIMDAIADALLQEFGSGYEIYTEKGEQELTTPCFLIRCLNPTKRIYLGRCFRRTAQFSIQYIPLASEALSDCLAVLERLFECLADVTVSEKIIHGTGLHGETADGILTVTVNYDGFELKEYTETTIEVMGVETKMKG